MKNLIAGAIAATMLAGTVSVLTAQSKPATQKIDAE